jgi:hypothetical protein
VVSQQHSLSSVPHPGAKQFHNQGQ